MTVKQAGDLPLAAVDLNSPVPLYHQIENNLRHLITTGVLEPDDTLPPEKDLSRVYGVGRHTVRMALSRLVADGLIARQPGRGTFIRYQPDRTRFYLDRSFTQQMAELGMRAHSWVLRTTNGTIDQTSPPPLRGKMGAWYFRVERLRYGDDRPIGLQTTTILTELCPGIISYNFNERSLYEILATEYRLNINRITHVVSAVVADRFQAELLQIAVGDPLLLVKTSAYLENETIIEYTVSYYRADQYEYSTTHTYGE
jgi:GntR family transcriptional regulator